MSLGEVKRGSKPGAFRRHAGKIQGTEQGAQMTAYVSSLGVHRFPAAGHPAGGFNPHLQCRILQGVSGHDFPGLLAHIAKRRDISHSIVNKQG